MLYIDLYTYTPELSSYSICLNLSVLYPVSYPVLYPVLYYSGKSSTLTLSVLAFPPGTGSNVALYAVK